MTEFVEECVEVNLAAAFMCHQKMAVSGIIGKTPTKKKELFTTMTHSNNQSHGRDEDGGVGHECSVGTSHDSLVNIYIYI